MPLYDYQCENCEKIFTAALSLREHDQHEVVCPGCDSKRVRQLITSFIAKTDSKTV